MPERLMAPRRARNPKGVFAASSPAVMPIIAKGMVKRMIRSGRTALNNATIINRIMAKAGIIPGINEAVASTVSSNSPPHSMV